MKTNRIIYWIATGIVALMMVNSAFMYVTKPEMKQAFAHLGFPDYFRIELAVMKVVGAILLLAPLSRSFKEWAYAGFAITFVSAFVAHSAAGDPMTYRVMPLIFLILLVVSYSTYLRSLNFTGKKILA